MEALLTTIASSAAAIIAIIGGLIATKLISFNAERSEIEIRLSDIKKEKDYRNNRIAELKNELIEDDAIDIITDVLDDFVDGTADFEDAYNKRQYDFSMDEIRPFWEKAKAAKEKLIKAYAEDTGKLNDDGIPIEFAKTLSRFESTICSRIIDKVNELAEKDKRERKVSNRGAGPFGFSIPDISSMISVPTLPQQYFSPVGALRAIKDEKATHENNVNLLSLQEGQLEARKQSLTTPRDMTLGLIIFLCYAAVSVIFPLIVLAILPLQNCAAEKAIKVISITLFAIGFAATALYFALFMRVRKPKSEDNK